VYTYRWAEGRIEREIEQADFEHRTIPNVNAEDRRFIRKMLNELSVSAEAKPTAAQASGCWRSRSG